jgi:hypothetical protein
MGRVKDGLQMKEMNIEVELTLIVRDILILNGYKVVKTLSGSSMDFSSCTRIWW